MKKSILVVAGETSGDNLGGGIISALRKKIGKDFDFWGFGGVRMQEAGVEIVKNIDDLAVIGFWEVLRNYKRLKGYLTDLVTEADRRNIAAAILIDYPGFNLKAAEMLRRIDVPVYLVVSPQIWAWNYKRVNAIRKNVQAVFCLYRFETKIYDKEKITSFFIGHPVTSKIAQFLKSAKNAKNTGSLANKGTKSSRGKRIALLPGSRASEISRHLPFLLDVAKEYQKKHPGTIFEIPSASDFITKMIDQYDVPPFVSIESRNSFYTLSSCDSAIVCSGTATLECALFNLPFLLIYKTSPITYFIGKQVLQIPYIGIVNVIAGKFVTREFVQSQMKVKPVHEELERITLDVKYIATMKSEFRKVRAEVEMDNPDLECANILAKLIQG